MSSLPRWGVYAYLCMMVAGIFFASLGILSAIENLRPNDARFPGGAWWGYPVLDHGGTGLVLILTTFAFFVVLVRRGGHSFAPLAYATSYLAMCFGFMVVLIAIEKHGAPGTIEDVYAGMPFYLGPGILITAASLIWNYKKGSRARAL